MSVPCLSLGRGGGGGGEGARVSTDCRSRWSRYLTNLDYSHSYTPNSPSDHHIRSSPVHTLKQESSEALVINDSIS